MGMTAEESAAQIAASKAAQTASRTGIIETGLLVLSTLFNSPDVSDSTKVQTGAADLDKLKTDFALMLEEYKGKFILVGSVAAVAVLFLVMKKK